MSDQDRISPYNIIECNVKNTSDENEEKYQLGNYKLIQYQILHTNITMADIKENYWQDLGS